MRIICFNMDKLNGSVQHIPYSMKCDNLFGRPTMKKLTCSVEVAGKILGIGRSAGYQAVRTGEIPAIRIGKRWLVLIQALEQRLSTAKPSTPEMQISAELIQALEQLLSTATRDGGGERVT